jgi:hypothetical protein
MHYANSVFFFVSTPTGTLRNYTRLAKALLREQVYTLMQPIARGLDKNGNPLARGAQRTVARCAFAHFKVVYANPQRLLCLSSIIIEHKERP